MSVDTPLASGRYISSALTSVGNVRQHNEDAFLSQPEQAHWVVADGMGGHQAGEVASHLAVNEIRRFIEPLDSPAALEKLKKAVEDAIITKFHRVPVGSLHG